MSDTASAWGVIYLMAMIAALAWLAIKDSHGDPDA